MLASLVNLYLKLILFLSIDQNSIGFRLRHRVFLSGDSSTTYRKPKDIQTFILKKLFPTLDLKNYKKKLFFVEIYFNVSESYHKKNKC